MSPEQAEAERAAQAQFAQGDSHPRSGKESIGYAVEARDGSIGEVQDFVIDEKSWAISDVVVDTRNWWPGGLVLVHPAYVEGIDWAGRTMRLRLTRDQIKRAGAATPPPSEQLASARTMVSQAQAVATKVAPLELHTAQTKLARAEQAMQRGDYVHARIFAEQAEVDAKYVWTAAENARVQRAASLSRQRPR